MALQFHECDRFRAKLIECPFRKFKEDTLDEEDDDEFDHEFDIRAMFPAKRKDEELRNLRQMPVIAHGDPVMKQALERLAAIKQDGGLTSIPNIPVTDFPLQGRGHPEIIAVLSAIAIMSALRGMRSLKSSPSLQAVRLSETRVAQGLSKALGRQSQGQSKSGGRVFGRGGIHVNAAADLQRLLGFNRKVGPAGPVPGVDVFSETGFN